MAYHMAQCTADSNLKRHRSPFRSMALLEAPQSQSAWGTSSSAASMLPASGMLTCAGSIDLWSVSHNCRHYCSTREPHMRGQIGDVCCIQWLMVKSKYRQRQSLQVQVGKVAD